jgi:hypothetical protein
MPRPPHALLDSFLASAAGYAAGSILILLVSLTPLGALFGALLDLRLVALFQLAGSALGWIVFLLPVAIAHRKSGQTDHVLGICAIAVAVAFASTWIETSPLTSYRARIFSMRELYIAAGVLNACVATIVLIRLRRRSAAEPRGEK